jgi:ketopantoate reductase
MRIAIVGSGGVGGFFGAKLAKGPPTSPSSRNRRREG